MRRWRVRGLVFRCPPCLAFALLCGAGTLLTLLTQTLIHTSRLSSRLETMKGSQSGTPCLLSRLYQIDCSRLFQANVTYMRALVDRKDWRATDLCERTPLPSVADDCEALRQKHGYHRWPVTDEELAFPLAFGLKIHHAPGMFERLLRVLWRPHNFYCVHVDSKTPPEVFRLVRNVTRCFPNIMLAQVRVDLVYLSVASLLSDMECMRAALKSKVPWKYYLNLSGQEFPLRTNLEMVQILTLLGGKNDVESYLPTSYITTWFTFKHYINNGTVYRSETKKEPFMYPLQMRKGSAYGAFSQPFIDFALNSQLGRELLRWLADAMAPDELFWSTLNHLPSVPGSVPRPVSHRYGTVLSRAVVWQWDEHRCHNYVRGVCIFTASDLPWLATRPELIANKFDEDSDPIALDCLEVALEERAWHAFRSALASPTPQPVDSLNWTFYQSLPHLKDV